MLGMAISLLFSFAALTAVAVIRRSLLAASARARLIVAELSEIERAAITRPSAGLRPSQAFRPRLAAA